MPASLQPLNVPFLFPLLPQQENRHTLPTLTNCLLEHKEFFCGEVQGFSSCAYFSSGSPSGSELFIGHYADIGELHCHLELQVPIGVFAFSVLRHKQSAQSVHHPATLPVLAVTTESVWDPLATPFCPPHCLSSFTPTLLPP